jgi:hypothetical protein
VPSDAHLVSFLSNRSTREGIVERGWWRTGVSSDSLETAIGGRVGRCTRTDRCVQVPDHHTRDARQGQGLGESR